MAHEPVPPPLTGFKRLNASTYIYEPLSINPSTTTTTTIPPPDLILLLTWLDAAPRHIAKYTRGYTALYPHARILLLTTNLPAVTLSTRRAEAARLAPALDVLTHLPPAQSGILLHSFSNGGAYTAHLLARLYRTRTGHVLPLGAQMLDSAPGKGQYGRTVTALAMGLPRKPRVAYVVMLGLLHVFLAFYWVVKKVTGGKSKIEAMSEGLLDAEAWDVAVGRCLVYSKEDKMVVWEDVVEHAEKAKKAGWKKVSVEEFHGSSHCGHLLVDEERYWKIVERVWGER